MFLTIVLRKEVDDEAEAQSLFEFVCNKLSGNPAVTITGQVNSQLKLEIPEE